MLGHGSFKSAPSQVIKQSFGFRGKLMPSWVTRLRQWWHKDCGGQPLSRPPLFGSFLIRSQLFWTRLLTDSFQQNDETTKPLAGELFGAWQPLREGKRPRRYPHEYFNMFAFWCMARQVNVIMWRPCLQFSSFGPLIFLRQQVVFVCDELQIKVWSSEMKSRQEKNVLKKDRSD